MAFCRARFESLQKLQLQSNSLDKDLMRNLLNHNNVRVSGTSLPCYDNCILCPKCLCLPSSPFLMGGQKLVGGGGLGGGGYIISLPPGPTNVFESPPTATASARSSLSDSRATV